RRARRQPAGQQFSARRAGVRRTRGAEHARASAIETPEWAAGERATAGGEWQWPAGGERGVHQESAIAHVAVRWCGSRRKRLAAGGLRVERAAGAFARGRRSTLT